MKTKLAGHFSAEMVRANARKLAMPGPRSQTQEYQPVIGVETTTILPASPPKRPITLRPLTLRS
jgi:hypothetical protein